MAAEYKSELDHLNVDPVYADSPWMWKSIEEAMGYSATVEKLKIAENPRIPDKVEKLYYDDLKASEALLSLYKHGFSTYYLQKIFSAGILGIRKNRKLVPTRWSITAVHSILAEELKREISECDTVNEHFVFHHEHFGNHFEVILYPIRYRFHLIEIWKRQSFWSPSWSIEDFLNF